MKRFFETVSVQETPEGFGIVLDARKVRTPLGHPFLVPNSYLAEEIAQEWRNQLEVINPRRMPLNQLMNTALDHMSAMRKEFTKELMRYAIVDPTCFRVLHPADLVERQQRIWGELHFWIEEKFGYAPAITHEMSVPEQGFDFEDAVKAWLDTLDACTFTAFQAMVSALSSFYVAVALLDGKYTPDEAFRSAYLDELYQTERWGNDDLARARHEVASTDVNKAFEFYTLCQKT